MRIATLLLSTTLFVANASSIKDKDSSVEQQFESWVKEFEREYNTEEEKEKRMKIWMENNEYIENHNSQEPKSSYEVGHNQFSDMTMDEYHQYNNLGDYAPNYEELIEPVDDEFVAEIKSRVSDVVTAESRRLDHDLQTSLKTSVNWVDEGVVTPVKNQGRCGSCWDFSAVGVIESASAIITGDLRSLSEQEILDCDFFDGGCNGGWPNRAFKFMKKYKEDGLCTENSYQYKAKKHSDECQVRSDDCFVANSTSVTDHGMLPKSAFGLKLGLNLSPVSVALNASPRAFRFYKKGIVDDNCSGTRINHAVIGVGYSTDEGYWLIRNSWGNWWGDKGYIKLSMESDNPSHIGQCGVYRFVATAIVE
jgi:C1A family cysteine protease